MEKDNKVISIDSILLDMQFRNAFGEDVKICEMEVRKFLNIFMTELYKYMRDYDEINFGSIGQYIKAIKRTPTIGELEESTNDNKVILANKDEIDNFKLYITKKKDNYKELL